MLKLPTGLVTILFGLTMMYLLWDSFIAFVQACIPMALILGGVLAIYLGIEEWKDQQAMAASECSTFDSGAEPGEAEADK